MHLPFPRLRRTSSGQLFQALTLREVPDWMIDAPADEPIDPARLPDAGYGQLLDRAVQRLREKNRTRVASPRGKSNLYSDVFRRRGRFQIAA